ncbi:pilus assembly protein CpaB [Roseovarius sp. MBR-51]
MRIVFGLVLMLGLGLAGFAVYMAKTYIDGYQQQLALERQQRAPNIETVDIYVANQLIKYGEPLTTEAVRLIAFPKDSLPEGAFSSTEELFPSGASVVRKALRRMEKNEPILAVKVTKPGEEAGITSQLERGMRAFAIKVDVTSGVSGFLRPGDTVDIYWTGSIGAGNLRTEEDSTGDVTKLIDTGVKLIAVDQVADMDMTEAVVARTVAVAVTPNQVAALAQAQSTGRLSLSLVGASDDTVAQSIEVDQRRLLGLTAQAVVKQEAIPETCTIRTRRGAEVIETPIPCTN